MLNRIKAFLTFTAIFLVFSFRAFSQVQHAPAYPLITHSPYFSVWSFSDSLNASPTKHWSGGNQPITGLIKVDDSTYNFMGQAPLAQNISILPSVDEMPYTCPYLQTVPATGWQNIDFDDSAWPVGKPVFGNNAANPTAWNTPDIYIRRVFNVDSLNNDRLELKLYHDDKVEVYLNGVQVYAATNFNGTYGLFPIANHLVAGKNVLSVHCHNTTGGAALDIGLIDLDKFVPHSVITKAHQNSVNMTATKTEYSFKCGNVGLNLTFMSPVLLNDLNLLSRPVTYMSYKVAANDGRTHDVKVYIGVSGDIARNQSSQTLVSAKYTSAQLSILKTGTVAQPLFGGHPDKINWGYFYTATPKTYNATQFISAGLFSNPFYNADTTIAASQGTQQLLNTIVPFGQVGQGAVEKIIEVAYDEVSPIQFFGQNLPPYWKTDASKTIEGQISIADSTYNAVLKKCTEWDENLYADATKAGGDNYAKLCVLAYRQSVASNMLVNSPVAGLLYETKENSSGSFICTVDVMFPAFPLFVAYNPELVKGMLNGVFYYVEKQPYTANFAPHDIGYYPIATGQTYLAAMPIEESGNMIIMTAAVEHALKNADYAKLHWATLTKWADYLVSIGYDPPSQLTSDDFAGRIPHNLNLSAKLINAIAAYAGMAKLMGDDATFTKYYTIAKQYAASYLAKGNQGSHFPLEFDLPNTWSQKYNICWDKILGMKLFPRSMYDQEIKYYLTKVNKYGIPQDSRQTYTKSDWTTWTAMMAYDLADFKTLTDPLLKFANDTQEHVPLSDFYQTITGLRQGTFTARAVVGGFFIKMLERQWQLDTTCATPVVKTTDNIGLYSAQAQWAVNSSAESFSFQYKQADSVNWVTKTLPVTDSVFQFSSLNSGTAYQWRVASICQAEPQVISGYSAVQSFKTLDCVIPAGTNTDAIRLYTASAHWALNSSAQSFAFQYKQADSTNWVTKILPATQASFQFSGLASGTNYQWRIAGICQLDPQMLSDFSAVQSFKTLDCNIPDGERTDSVGIHNAATHWAINSSAQSFSFQYKQADNTDWVTLTLPAAQSAYKLTSLLPATNYSWRIASVCQLLPALLSGYSSAQNFTTLPLPDSIKAGALTVTLSPNPAKTQATLTVKQAMGAVSVKMYNMNGKQLWADKNETNYNIAIPLLNIKAGAYFLIIRDNERARTVKFIKSD